MADVVGPLGAEKAAIRLIVRAVELDKENRFTESLLCYQEGIGLLMEAIKGTNTYIYIFICI
jgi:hypothetical protein